MGAAKVNHSPFPDTEADHNEGPGLLLSLAFWLGGTISALVCWTLIWMGLVAGFDALYATF